MRKKTPKKPASGRPENPSSTNPPQLLTSAQAAKILEVQTDTIRALVRRGLLQPTSTIAGRHFFTSADVELYHRQRRNVGRPRQQPKDKESKD